jgi:gas vesicle protein
MTTQRMHSNSLKIATFAGIAGASLALLFAPRSGRETRDRMRTRASTMRHKAGDKLETAKQTVEERAQAAMEMKDRAEQAMAAGKRSAREKYEELRNNKDTADMESSMPSDLRTNNEEEV